MDAIDDRATTGEKIDVRANAERDPMYYRANEVLKQIDHMRADRQKMLREADALYQRIQSLESEFRKMVLELKPTIVGEQRKREPSVMAKIQDVLNRKMVDDPAFQEKLEKLLNS